MTSWRLLAAEAIAVVVAVALGGFLRFERLGQPSYWLDETLGETLTTSALSQPWWHWLTGVDREHGPLYYAFQALSRAGGTSETAGRVPAALFGALTLLLVWYAGRRLHRWAGALGIFLIALSPLHVYYSREARPYSLLIALTAAATVALLRRWRASAVAVILLAMLYTSATAGPVLAAVTCAAACAALLDRTRTAWTVVVTSAIATVLVPFLYRGTPWKAAQGSFASVSVPFIESVFRGLTVTALGDDLHGRAMVAILGLALMGAAFAVRRDRRLAAVLVAMTLLPALFAVVSLWAANHWFAIRYVAPSLIGLAILTAAGIVAFAEGLLLLMPSRRPKAAVAAAPAAAVIILVLIGRELWPTARREAFRKLDWRAIATMLEEHARPGDVIATAEPYSYLSLQRYLRVPRGVHFVLLDLVSVAERWMEQAPAAWLVNAGYATPVSDWMCRYPVVLGSPLEGFRLRYAPSATHFLMSRSHAPERRAVATALGTHSLTYALDSEDEPFLGEGWAQRDAARWAIGRRASLLVPRGEPRDRVIGLRVFPFTAAGLAPQTMRVILNRTSLSTITLQPEWRDYEVKAPRSAWADGLNTVTFEFARAVAPATLDPASPDRRELAVNFERFQVTDVGFPNGSRSAVTMRLGADRFLDATTLWRGTSTRFPARRLRRPSVESLVARLGYDPAYAWPLLARGDVRLDDVVETVATGAGCEENDAFLTRAYRLLLGRTPSDDERKAILERLNGDQSRLRMAGRIAKTDEFRRMVMGPEVRAGEPAAGRSVR